VHCEEQLVNGIEDLWGQFIVVVHVLSHQKDLCEQFLDQLRWEPFEGFLAVLLVLGMQWLPQEVQQFDLVIVCSPKALQVLDLEALLETAIVVFEELEEV